MKRGSAALDVPVDSHALHPPAAISAPLACKAAVRQSCTLLHTQARAQGARRVQGRPGRCVCMCSVPSVTCVCCAMRLAGRPLQRPFRHPARVWSACCACRGNAPLPRQLNTLICPAGTPQPARFWPVLLWPVLLWKKVTVTCASTLTHSGAMFGVGGEQPTAGDKSKTRTQEDQVLRGSGEAFNTAGMGGWRTKRCSLNTCVGERAERVLLR